MTTDTRIQKALERALSLGEVGVQVAAYLGDRLIVDAGIGVADDVTGRTVDNAIFPIFSVSKAFIITAFHMQQERGMVDIDAPIATYWPDYAAEGKINITPRHVLTHRAGVPQMPTDLTQARLADWDWIVDQLARVTPLCPPGERSMYHPMSFGYILGEIVRRTDPKHRLPGAFIREEILEPLEINEVWFGLPSIEEPRVARLTWGATPPVPLVVSTPMRAMAIPAAMAPVPEVFNLPKVHQACIPAANGIASARDGAKFFSMLAHCGESHGKRFICESRLRSFLVPRPNPYEVDECIGMATWVGAGGYWVGGEHPPADLIAGRSKSILAHGGAGGSIGWADLDLGLSAMITHNRMFGAVTPEQHPFKALGEAIREIAAEQAR